MRSASKEEVFVQTSFFDGHINVFLPRPPPRPATYNEHVFGDDRLLHFIFEYQFQVNFHLI